MTFKSLAPHYRLNTVMEETGLGADTVRAWERRYGLPRPQRTPGGQRLYSRRDIRTLQWLVARQREGMRISQAVARWRELGEAGQDPLAMDHGESPLAAERLAWLHACMDFDKDTAETVLESVVQAHGPRVACMQVLVAGMRDVGELWYQDQASVQQEHFATEIAMGLLYRLLREAPSPTRDRLIVGAPSGEHHVLPALLLTVMLRWEGWDVVYLGADIPTEYLRRVLRQVNPIAVVYVVQLLQSAASAQETARLLAQEKVPFAYGGGVFHRLAMLSDRISGMYLGETFEDALLTVKALPHLDVDFSASPPSVDPAFLAAAEGLETYASVIRARVLATLVDIPLPEEQVAVGLDVALDQWIAALRLGVPECMRHEMSWVSGLLSFRGIEPAYLSLFWNVWAETVSSIIGETAHPIIEYLATDTIDTDAVDTDAVDTDAIDTGAIDKETL